MYLFIYLKENFENNFSTRKFDSFSTCISIFRLKSDQNSRFFTMVIFQFFDKHKEKSDWEGKNLYPYNSKIK